MTTLTSGGLPSPSKFSFQIGGPRFQSNFQKSNHHHHHHHHHHHGHQLLNATQFRPLTPSTQQGGEFDGKRLRKAVTRRTIDYNAAVVRQLQVRVWQRDRRDHRAIQPDYLYYPEMVPPPFFVHNPINAVTTKFVRTSTNKMRCPIFCVAWTPEGRRLVTGASSGEFTLWNGLTFNFETILQAHDSPVRCMVWSHTDQWMVTGDHAGFVKYWQSNMNNVKMFQAHKEPLRGISFCPTDTKFATCSDDGTVRIWDFLRCHEEKILRGHGADVKCVAWHPHKALLVSGSKDSQQPIKLWDPKSGTSLATLHAHKSTVMEAKWNDNGNWLLTGSRDHLIKLFDIRKLSQEMQTFRGHKKEVSSLAWHPMHESLFASGGSDGALMFWLTGVDKEVGSMEQAHDSIVWSLDWHPLGHILCSGSNDHTCKFWTRNRPGDKMRDKYNLNMMPAGSMEDMSEYDEMSVAPSIPGMGFDQLNHIKSVDQIEEEMMAAAIPGLDFGSEEPQMPSDSKASVQKKIPHSKPIPKQFQQQWMDPKPVLGTPPPSSSSSQQQQKQLHESPNANQTSISRTGDGQNSVSSLNPAMIPLPPQHVVQNVPPPPVPQSQQAFANRMMVPGPDLSQGPPPPQRMPMMWPPPPVPRPSGMPEGQIRPPFPPMGNGNQFSVPPPSMVGIPSGLPPPLPQPNTFTEPINSGGQRGQENNNNWKEYGDSDFRMPMDSDLRLLNSQKTVSKSPQPSSKADDFENRSRDPKTISKFSGGGDERDLDMRTQLRDTDARVPVDFSNAVHGGGGGGGGGSKQNSLQTNDGRSSETTTTSGGSGRRGRWGPFLSGVRGGAPFNNPPPPPFGKGDLDERLLPSNQQQQQDGGIQPDFSQPPPPVPRKRGWDVGPGMVDLKNQNHRDGNANASSLSSSHQQMPTSGPPQMSQSGAGQRDGLPPQSQQHQQLHMQQRDDHGNMRINDSIQQRFMTPPPPLPPGRGIPAWAAGAGPMHMGMRMDIRMAGGPGGGGGGGGGSGGGGGGGGQVWFRGGGPPFRGGPPPLRGRMGMRGPFPP